MSASFSILYITINEHIGSQKDGVAKKLLSKVEAIRSQADNCILLNASASLLHDNVTLLDRNSLYINIEIGVRQANTGYLNKANADKHFYSQLAGFIMANKLPCDRIIFRYPFASLGLRDFTGKFKGRIVFEHNTKETEELKMEAANKGYAAFGLRPSQFFYWLQEKKYPLYCERYVSKHIFKNAAAGACVTSEIAAYERGRNRGYRTFVSSNFYNVGGASLSSVSYDGKSGPLKLGMIVTTTAPWYGLERLFSSFGPVQAQYQLIIAGIEKDNAYMQKLLTENNIRENVTFLGKVDQQGLVAFYNTVHICFGSLGLYKINLQYASTLKVKESVAFGVPVATAYNEEDFTGNAEFAGAYLPLENNATPVDFEKVRQFALQFYADPASKEKLRSLAFKYLDTGVKIKSLIANIRPA